MDKKFRDVRRVFSRESVPNNSNKLVNSGDLKKKKKLSKEKVKRLSVVEREMGFDVEDSGKFMLPKKIFSDSKTSVPRKLRSAIRKRSCDSPSGPLPDARISNSVDLLRKDCLKKSKITLQNNGSSDHSLRGCGAVTISKDEEEVAETLFALAGMIRRNGRHVNNKNENESLGTKTSSSWNTQHSDSTPLAEEFSILTNPMIPKEEPVATNPTTATTSTSPRDFKLSETRQLNLDFRVSVPPVHFQIPPLLRPCDDRKLTNSTFLGLTDQNQENRFIDAREEKSQHIIRESHINIGAAELPASHDRKFATSMQCRDNGLTLRPSHGSGIDGVSVQSSAMVFPSCLDNTSTIRPSFCEDIASVGKASGIINGGRKSWRRCVAHVYISHLIQALQTSEGRDAGPSDTCQLKSSQQSSAARVADKDGLNGTLAVGLFASATNDVHLHLKNRQIVEKEEPTFSGWCDSKKQRDNFLSLSTGVGPEVNNGVNMLGMTLEAKGHVLQLHSIPQQSTYMPSSMPQNSFPTISYRDQVAIVSAAPPSMSQVHLQVPSYIGNSCELAYMGTTRSTQQAQPKQQQMWAAQLAAQFRPGPFLSSHSANWQSSTQDPRSMNHMQAHPPPPRPSLEATGSKYLHMSQQQQQQLLGLRPSFPTSNTKLQNSQVPSLCEDKVGRFHPDGVLPLQLLCKERLLS